MGFSYNVNVLNQKGSPAIYTDTFANRPAFGFAGRLFISNDTAAIYEDTGTAWVLIANVSSGAGTLQQVTTNGNTSNVGISVTAGGVSTNSATITSLTQGSVPFIGAAGLITQDNTNLFFDDTNNRLGINTNTPSNNLDVHGTGTTALIALNNTAGNQSLIAFAKNSTAKWRIGNSSTDTFDVLNVGLATNAITISSASNSVSFLASIKIQQAAGFAGIAGFNGIGCDAGGFFFQIGTNTNNPYFNFIGLTGARTYTYPDATGTLALTSNLAAYLPLAGGTMTGTLNGTTITFGSNANNLLNSGNFQMVDPAGLKYLQVSITSTLANIATNYSDSNIPLSLNSYGNANQLYLSTGGKVLLGSNVDDTVNKLQVTGSAKITGDLTLQYGNVVCWNSSSNQYIIGDANNLILGTNNFAKLYINNAGVVTLVNLAGTGSRAVLADASGNLSAPVSDISVKENIEPLKYGLNAIMQLNPISFEYIDEYKNYGEGLQIGNIAQDVAKVIPEAVFTTPSTGLMGINYNQFDGIYIKAIQELNERIELLLSRIEYLENK